MFGGAPLLLLAQPNMAASEENRQVKNDGTACPRTCAHAHPLADRSLAENEMLRCGPPVQVALGPELLRQVWPWIAAPWVVIGLAVWAL
jgi:hypothetical protein